MSKVKEGNFEAAISILDRLSTESPRDLRVWNLSGIALSGAGRREEATRRFQRALKVDPTFQPAIKNLALNQLALATSYVEKKEPAKAVAALSQIPGQAGPDLHFEAGLILARIDQYEAAAGQFALARKGASDPYQVEFNLTLAHVKGGKYAAATQEAEGIIAGGQRTSEVYSLLAQALEGSGKTAQAYEALRSATLANPKDETPYLELIALCAEHENFDLSMKVADAGIHTLPDSHRLFTQRGIVLAMMGRFPEAEMDLRRASELAPADTMAPVARTLVLMRTERTAEAVEYLRRQPDDYLVDWFLAEALTRLGADDAEAIGALEKSVRLNPEVSQSRILLGKLLLARGDTDGAINQLEKSLELEPGNIAATYQLAQAYRKKGNATRAAELSAKVGKARAEEGDQLTRNGLLRIIRQRPR